MEYEKISEGGKVLKWHVDEHTAVPEKVVVKNMPDHWEDGTYLGLLTGLGMLTQCSSNLVKAYTHAPDTIQQRDEMFHEISSLYVCMVNTILYWRFHDAKLVCFMQFSETNVIVPDAIFSESFITPELLNMP